MIFSLNITWFTHNIASSEKSSIASWVVPVLISQGIRPLASLSEDDVGILPVGSQLLLIFLPCVLNYALRIKSPTWNSQNCTFLWCAAWIYYWWAEMQICIYCRFSSDWSNVRRSWASFWAWSTPSTRSVGMLMSTGVIAYVPYANENRVSLVGTRLVVL